MVTPRDTFTRPVINFIANRKKTCKGNFLFTDPNFSNTRFVILLRATVKFKRGNTLFRLHMNVLTEQGAGVSEGPDLGVRQASEQRKQRREDVLIVNETIPT